MAVFRDKKYVLVLCLLLIFLILPRIIVYPMFGKGMMSTDAEHRYFPQVEELSESLTNFFHQNGPLYSLFLLFFDKASIDPVAGPVAVQHILGIITALFVFCFFRKINLFLAFFVAIFIYSNWIAMWIEHTILRDSLAAFLLISLIIFVFFNATKLKYFKFRFALLAGSIGLISIFIRVEFIALFLLMPLILFIVRKRVSPDLKFKDKAFLKWSFGYFLPALIAFVMFITMVPQTSQAETPYGFFFNIAFLNLIPEAFYYEGSQYPELLRGYQEILETNENKMESNEKNREIVGKFHEVTDEYLSERPEIELSKLGIMDKIFIEIMTKNTSVHLKSFFINLKNQILGISELDSLITKYELSESASIDRALRTYNISMVWFSIILFWLSLISLPLLLFKWKTLAPEIVMIFLVSAIHLPVLAFLTDANHRFKYPIDPFIYFLQFYLILLLLKVIISGFKKYIICKKIN